jgi:DNA-binding transcriptional LysR family regulator
MELRQLEYFLLVAESKGFQRAATKAYISQQALSKSIQNLENELGVPLFTREATGVELNSYGKMFEARARHILEYTDESINLIHVFRENKNDIRFGLTVGLLEMGMEEHLSKFQEENPDIELILYETSDVLITDAVQNGKLDIGMCAAYIENTGLDSTIFQRYPTYVALKNNHPLAARKSVRMADLRTENFLTCPADYNVHRVLVNACAKAGFEPRFVVLSIDNHRIKRYLLKYGGVVCFPKNLFGQIASPDIVFIPIEDDPFLISLNLIVKKGNKPMSAANQKLFDYILKLDTANFSAV